MSSPWREPIVRRLAIVVLALVAFDLLTKELARRFLPVGEPVQQGAWLQLVLCLNDTGFGRWASALLADTSGKMLVVSAVGELGFAAYLLRVRDLKWSRRWTFVAGLGVFGIAAFVTTVGRDRPRGWLTLFAPVLYWVFVHGRVSELTRKILAGYGTWVGAALIGKIVLSRTADISRFTGSLTARASGCVLFLTVLWIVRRSPWRAPAVLFAAAALGNGISQALPPHAIVDFIYSAPLTRFAGHGVMNVADLYFDAAGVTVVLLVVHSAVRRLRRAPSRSAEAANSEQIDAMEDERKP